MRPRTARYSCGPALAAAVTCWFCVWKAAVSALQILPPIEHPDRASAASGSSVQTDMYNHPQWVKSWWAFQQ